MSGACIAYKKDTSGATAIEFALLMMPFFMLIMGTIELSLFYASGVALEGAANGASRIIRTGQAQNSGDPVTMFEEKMCDEVGVLMNCEDITYEVVNFGGSFGGVSGSDAGIDADGNMVSSGFDAGGPDEVIMVRMAYRHEFLMPLMGRLLQDDTGTNSAQHISTVVLRTEPYSF